MGIELERSLVQMILEQEQSFFVRPLVFSKVR